MWPFKTYYDLVNKVKRLQRCKKQTIILLQLLWKFGIVVNLEIFYTQTISFSIHAKRNIWTVGKWGQIGPFQWEKGACLRKKGPNVTRPPPKSNTENLFNSLWGIPRDRRMQQMDARTKDADDNNTPSEETCGGYEMMLNPA